MTLDPSALAWFSLGALVMLTLGLLGLVALGYQIVGRHFLWALSIASRRAVDRKMGTGSLELPGQPSVDYDAMASRLAEHEAKRPDRVIITP
jgi:hypothetical protein